MFTHSRLIGMTVALFIALWCSSSVAYAEGPDYDDPTVVRGIMEGLEAADDPHQAFSQLLPAAQQAIGNFLTVASIGSEQEGVGQPDVMLSQMCDTHSRKRIAYNIFGNKLWTYQSDTSWCWDGTQITTDPLFAPSGQVHFIFWEFVGHVYTSESGGQGDWVHLDYAQGHFKLCFGSDNCVVHNYPWIRKYQYGDGVTSWDHD